MQSAKRQELYGYYNEAVEFMGQARSAANRHNTMVRNAGEVPVKEAMDTTIAILGPLTDAITKLAQCMLVLIQDTEGSRL
jgi:hypothetical protein